MKKLPRKESNRLDIVFALSGGVLLSAAQPPLFPAFLAFFCLVPLFAALRGKGYRSVFFLGYIWGFTSNLLSLYWIAMPTFAGMVCAVLILSLYNAVFALIFSFVERRSEALALALSPIIWTGMEFIRGYGITGFPWMDLGYTQGPYAVIIQMADLVGHRGISFWIVLVNVLIFAIFFMRKRIWLLFIALIVVVLLPIGYGIYKLNQPPLPDSIEVALLQGNIGAEQKWEGSFRRKNVHFFAAMIDSLDRPVDLIVMPETATAHYHSMYPALMSVLQEASARADAPILTGTLDFDPGLRKTHYYNASVVVTATKIGDSYHKMELVPMSEHIPFQDKFPALRKIEVGGSHFRRGTEYKVFDVDGMKFGSPICFEALFGRSARGFARGGARFLVNITNDDWFGMSPGPYQHANFSRFRAVENRLGIARCAQTGISILVDEKGRIKGSLPLHVKGTLIGNIPLAAGRTLFTEIGDWVGYGSLIATPLLLIILGLMFRI